MANAFRIMDSSNVITTYTDYDDIPLTTLKHVISFIPDLGTRVDSNEILLEPDSSLIDSLAVEDELGFETVILLNGTDGSSTDAGDKIRMESANGVDRIIPENWTTSSENHLMLETASELGGTNHYHEPSNVPHVDGDGHTETEHREIALWDYKLKLLITQENTNAVSN
tara:strand:+ start:173 stop:679 length:507 start_codon:yes stop_codon:yes gene_type:complete